MKRRNDMPFRLGMAFINANKKVFIITELHLGNPKKLRETPYLTVDILEDRITHYYSPMNESELFKVTLSEMSNKSNKSTKTVEELNTAITEKIIKQIYL